jgi:hypothetical protein
MVWRPETLKQFDPVDLILVPETKDGLNLAVGKAHKRYTRRINFREGWRGHQNP